MIDSRRWMLAFALTAVGATACAAADDRALSSRDAVVADAGTSSFGGGGAVRTTVI